MIEKPTMDADKFARQFSRIKARIARARASAASNESRRLAAMAGELEATAERIEASP